VALGTASSLLDAVHSVVIQSVNSQHVTPRHDQIKVAAAGGDEGQLGEVQVFQVTFSCSEDAGPMRASAAQLSSIFLSHAQARAPTQHLARLIHERFTIAGVRVVP
jgi:hypothetical protein